jgi:hypothetical protein
MALNWLVALPPNFPSGLTPENVWISVFSVTLDPTVFGIVLDDCEAPLANRD